MKLKVKYFGPIKEGYQENGGWMEIEKVTVFIGNQGSGKSTIAKLISTLVWLEKAINRGDVDKGRVSIHFFKQLFNFQGIYNYFRRETEIQYSGEFISIKYMEGIEYPIISLSEVNYYAVPKIMYVPAERNLLSAIENINKISGVLSENLLGYAVEFKNAQIHFNGVGINLPINDTKISYNSVLDEISISNNDYKISLAESSSGFHSFVPMFLVSKYLINLINKGKDTLRESLSVEQSIQRNSEISEIMFNENLSNKEKEDKVKKIDDKYIPTCLINIIEEPEQNLYPSSQWLAFQSLLEFNSERDANKLIITTHSPYLLNYLSLAVKGFNLSELIKTSENKNKHILGEKVEKVIPNKAYVNPSELVIYEMDEKMGEIKKLDNYQGLPSDDNYLNMMLKESNIIFDSLLDIEEEIGQ